MGRNFEVPLVCQAWHVRHSVIVILARKYLVRLAVPFVIHAVVPGGLLGYVFMCAGPTYCPQRRGCRGHDVRSYLRCLVAVAVTTNPDTLSIGPSLLDSQRQQRGAASAPADVTKIEDATTSNAAAAAAAVAAAAASGSSPVTSRRQSIGEAASATARARGFSQGPLAATAEESGTTALQNGIGRYGLLCLPKRFLGSTRSSFMLLSSFSIFWIFSISHVV